MKIYIILMAFTLMLPAQNSEEHFYKDKNAHADGFALHTDLGYSSYLIELDSSELNSAIDYDVLEFTLGTTYSYNKWMFGLYGKFLIKALESNMFVVTTQQKLGNQAEIEKDEFGLYANYTLKEQEDEVWKLNFIYRYANLNAKDTYMDFYTYGSSFNYKTQGFALSLLYTHRINEKSSWFTQVGLLYSDAVVEMSESVNHQLQDSFIDDGSKALGGKLSLGYSHQLKENLFLTLRTDAWRLNFGELEVSSRVGDTLPKAKLKEQSFTTYGGISWRF